MIIETLISFFTIIFSGFTIVCNKPIPEILGSYEKWHWINAC